MSATSFDQPIDSKKHSEQVKAIFLQQLEKQRQTDPLIGAKIGGKELLERLIAAMKTEKGVHAESLLCALASLAGYACQAAVRAEWVEEKGQLETKAFTIISTNNGQRFFFGDLPNQALIEQEYSVLRLSAGVARELGAEKEFDFKSVFEHVAASIGSDSFGVPRLPDGHRPGDLPIKYLQVLWPNCLALVKEFCAKPAEWPILFGIAIQQAMLYCKAIMPPDLALTIVMESAVPMAKVDLQAVVAPRESFDKPKIFTPPYWLQTHEGKIVVLASGIYLLLAISGPFGFGLLRLPSLYALLSLVLPLILPISAYYCGVFKPGYKGSWFDKAMYWSIALMPVMLQIYNALKAKLA